MRIRITRLPTDAEGTAQLDIDVSRYEIGRVYDVGPLVGSYLVVMGYAEPEMRAVSRDSASPRGLSAGRRPVVLLVDDVIEQLNLYEMALINRYQVVRASRGQLAVEMAKTAHPDIIVLDVMLPDLNGVTVCEHLKSTPATADIPVLFLTAYETPALTLQATRIGAAALLSKPCPADKLIRTIDGTLGIRAKSTNLH